ncbi:hypothetical protein LMG33818_000878 [Halomonadaceae bacterium LMG 33818]
MDFSKILEVLHNMSANPHSRRLAWGAVAVAAIWAVAKLIAAIAPSGLIH